MKILKGSTSTRKPARQSRVASSELAGAYEDYTSLPTAMSSSTTRLLHRFIHSSSHRPPLQGVQTRSLSSSLHAPSCSRSAVLPLLTQLRSAQRPFSTSPVTRAYRAPKVEGEPTVLSAKPSPETEDDIDLVPDEQAKLLLTRRAAEVCLHKPCFHRI